MVVHTIFRMLSALAASGHCLKHPLWLQRAFTDYLRHLSELKNLNPGRATPAPLDSLSLQNAKKITFEGFCKALYLLSDKLGIGFPDLMQQVWYGVVDIRSVCSD